MNPSGLLESNHPQMKTICSALDDQAQGFSREGSHLKHLITDPDRLEKYSIQSPNFVFDFSRQRLDQKTIDLLLNLAEETHALDTFFQMTRGDLVNPSEKRPALHTAARGSGKGPIQYKTLDVRKEMDRVNQNIATFSKKIHQGKITPGCNRPFTAAVVVGIGGSYLGCEFLYEALGAGPKKKLPLYFLANVDIDNFARIIGEVDPETCLWIVISKSYTTTETMANLNQVLWFLKEKNLNPKNHLVTVTAQKSPGDNPDTPMLASFHIFDFIGGRYSVSSAVGGLPISLAFGTQCFEQFLQGCKAMDTHVLSAEPRKNIPLVAALISIWNTIFLNYPGQAVIPYASSLSKLAPHVQQLYMESMGKSVSAQGTPLSRAAGTIIFGEPGTNAQHSFFQLAHQGPAFPIEFIGVLNPGYKGYQVLSKGVTNHQELWANLLAQANALAKGQAHDTPARQFTGNRPSSILVLKDLEPESLGMLLAFYEARTVLEGFILGLNPFDQFGVELGKTMATKIKEKMAAKNKAPEYDFEPLDPDTKFYLNLLFDQ
ncbi:MAG: glucose-6-phosphate isomerase [Desulfobacter sp.]|nr:glucose-6-phosphate isomerase [Desulfobacter sp.]